MPRENRKRGKKHKKQHEQPVAEAKKPETESKLDQDSIRQPSWILPAASRDDTSTDAPFGFLDLDVKAYFRTVDQQIREWQNSSHEPEEDAAVDSNEDKRTFFMAALNEMQGKEKQLATDPECSVILERMLYSMDDFVRRVFVDSLTGSYEILARNRFASHVCQTLFITSTDTIVREMNGSLPDTSQPSDQGELRNLTQLVLDICEELLPSVPSLVTDPFASHVIRSVIFLFCPTLEGSNASEHTVRSKKSRAWKARQGQMTSVFANGVEKGKGKGKDGVPPGLTQMAGRIIEGVRGVLSENEVRAMAADKVACPTLKVLLEVEAEQNMANQRGSLMDQVTVGAISACLDDEEGADVQESDFLGTLMRDANASHVLETILARCPPAVFNVLWTTYFEQSLARLSIHPVANFVVAKALERVSPDQDLKALEEIKPIAKKLIQNNRSGVLKALVDRAVTLNVSVGNFQELIHTAFDIKKPEFSESVISCVLAVLPYPDYKLALSKLSDSKSPKTHRHRTEVASDPLEPKVQGSLLLQSLLRLPEPSNQFINDAVLSLSVEERIRLSHNATSSRIFDALLDSPSVPSKCKRQFVMDFIGHYNTLVDDKIGSRVGDRCWAFSDTYLKEKIARSLLTHEQDLAASFYGKFFARNLNLHLLQRRPQEWRNTQSSRSHAHRSASLSPSTPRSKPSTESNAAKPGSLKRKQRPDDEIDALFDQALGKRVKKAALDAIHLEKGDEVHEQHADDKEMLKILGAIKIAPAGEPRAKSKGKRYLPLQKYHSGDS